jgi:hypothetical protein
MPFTSSVEVGHAPCPDSLPRSAAGGGCQAAGTRCEQLQSLANRDPLQGCLIDDDRRAIRAPLA